jgi:uncharacterized membrane protein YbhN (UPF0104 family)
LCCHRLAHVGPGWLALAAVFEVLSSLSYVALFHPVFCPGIPWRISYRIGMSEVGVSALLPAAGVGGLALGAWVLSRRGMAPERIAARSVAFFLLTSAANVAALALFGFGLALGVFNGPAPLGLTLLPALVALAVVPIVLLLPRAASRTRLCSCDPATHWSISGRSATGRSTTPCCGSASARSATPRRSPSSPPRTSSASSAAPFRCRPASAGWTSA